MAKRGRPSAFDHIMREIFNDSKGNAVLKALLSNPDLTKRQQQNRYYADIISLFVLDEISNSIPYLDEIKKHPTIMEQLGRLVFQDRYGGENIIKVFQLTANWYHNKQYTAKEIVSWLKEVRCTGMIQTVSYRDGKEINHEYKLEKVGFSETASENQ